jgi:hypothetical protein
VVQGLLAGQRLHSDQDGFSWMVSKQVWMLSHRTRQSDGVVGVEKFFLDNLLAQIQFIVEMVLVDRPFAMGV